MYGWKATFIATGILGFIWLEFWLLLYYPRTEHKWLTAQEKAYIEGDEVQEISTAKSIPYTDLLKYKETWAIVLARFLVDPVWWLYIVWLPKYLFDARGFDLKQIGLFAWFPFVAAGLVAPLGTIDILVNNAGSLVERLRTAELTEERWDEVFALNVKSAFFAAQAVIPKMLEKGSGVIINVTSIAGRNGGAMGSIHYSAAKGAMLTMTKGLAKEFAAQGIHVNAVSPGVIDTPFHEVFSTPEAIKNFADNIIPMGRVGKSAEVARTIAFLASEASSYLCGETIEINGVCFDR